MGDDVLYGHNYPCWGIRSWLPSMITDPYAAAVAAAVAAVVAAGTLV